MLVLSRKVGERIVVANDIRITVVRVTNGGVRLGIEAPDGTPVVREELLIQQLARQAAEAGSGDPE
jgi:carbon storage regulator